MQPALSIIQSGSVERRRSRRHQAWATEDQRWRAVCERNPDAERAFVYAVTTTKICCRPGCPSRLPSRKHVVFFSDLAGALQSGFRPCKRCNPAGVSNRETQEALMAEACRRIEKSEGPPALKDLAKALGMSAFHFHRTFKKLIGVTPREYAAELRAGRIRRSLRATPNVTQAIYDAGYQSSSRFYDKMQNPIGMTPTNYRDGGNEMEIQHAFATTPLGLVLIAATARGICSVRFGNTRRDLLSELAADFPRARLRKGDKCFADWMQAVVRQIESPASRMDIPIDIRGTAFQHQVWRALRNIPAGRTATYTEVAAQIGKPAAVRAVAGACAANPVAVVVPCHRVIRSDGSLSGFRWGQQRKKAMLQREGVAVPDPK